jgi:hypothetical protein
MSDSEQRMTFTRFRPRAYLAEYYGGVGPENDGLLAFYARRHGTRPSGGRLLEVGGGPVIYPLISAARPMAEIHFTDVLQENLDEVRAALDRTPEAFDWRPFAFRALEHELGRPPTVAEIDDRLRTVRDRVTRLLPLNLWESPDIGTYDVVQANFVLDSITSSLGDWQGLLRTLTERVVPGGELLMCALEGSRWWRLGDHQFPAVSLDREMLGNALVETGMRDVTVDRIGAETVDAEQGYSGILCAHAFRI